MFWTAVSSPLLVIGAAAHIGTVLDLFGANCVTYGNNPMALDNTTVCNQLGEVRSGVGWAALGIAIVLVPLALITGAVGRRRTVTQRSH
jgi:hypothetical protein